MNPRAAAARLLLASVLLASAALAKDSAMVLDFKGKQARAVRDRVVKAVGKAGVAVTPAGGRAQPRDDDARRAVGKKRGVTLFLEGEVTTSKAGWALALSSHGAGSGGEGSLSLDAKSEAALLKRIDAEVPDFVRTELASTESAPEPPKSEPAADEATKPAEPEKKPEEAPAKDEEQRREPAEKSEPEGSAKPDSGERVRPSPLFVSLGAGVFSRHLSYHQDVNGNLRPYDLGAAPVLRAALEWYPGAHFTSGAGAHLGIVGDFEQSLGAQSELDATGAKYGSSMRAFSVGLRGRLPLGAHEVGLAGRYGSHAFAIDGDLDPSATSAGGTTLRRDLVPNVAYSYLEPALDARFAFGGFGVGAVVGYRIVLSAGDVQDPVWFPASKVSALRAGLVLSYELVKSLSVFAGVDIRRYGYSMHSKPSDLAAGKDVAGGAIDQYLAATGGLFYRLPGH